MAIFDILRRLARTITGRKHTTGPTGAEWEAAEREAARKRLLDLAEAERGRRERQHHQQHCWSNWPTMPYNQPLLTRGHAARYQTSRR